MTVAIELNEDARLCIQHLIDKERGVVAAYESAIARVQALEYRHRLGEFVVDHHEYLSKLRDLAREAGIGVTEAEVQMKDELHGLVDDKDILGEIKRREDEMEFAYARAAAVPGWPADAARFLERTLGDAGNRRLWLADASLPGAQAAA